MLHFIAKLFGGNKSKRDIEALLPVVARINTFYESFHTLSNDELRGKTLTFKTTIQSALRDINNQMEEVKTTIANLPESDMLEQEKHYHRLEELHKEHNKELEKVLWEILPEAFAVIKESACRFTENVTLEATATETDKILSAKKNYITIKGDKVIFSNTWKVMGRDITWNMVHYDVQLIGGIVLHQGKIAEMATGEGKTLVSTLPAYLNGLAGEGVHIITVNEYLSKRDAEWNAPLFEWLGLSVDCIDKHTPHSEGRKNAYLADITYGTNNEFGFDYLRDNMVSEAEERVQRKYLHFGMIDEVDSVLIDDARTPLIISGPVGKDETQQKFYELKPNIEKLVTAQKKLLSDTLAIAKKKIAESNESPKDGGLDLYRVYRGLPKNPALIKYLSEPGIKAKLHKIENHFLADNQKEMRTVDAELFFYIDEKNNVVDLTEKGINFLTDYTSDKHFFTLPDLAVDVAEIDKESDLSETERNARKEKIIQEYTEKADRIHTVQQLLKAYTLFNKDVEYVVIENQVKIVDEQTGRIMEGRRYSNGLHQALEAKENVKIEAASQTYATVTLQNYFRMFHKLAGMTGTAETEATEFWQIYKLDVVSIPTNIPVVRTDNQDLVFKTKREKYKAIITEVQTLTAQSRPVLVGTTSVEISELLSRMLKQKNIAHNVLNAKQHLREAQIIAEAGLPGKVTIATNMAGRGTDIKLSDSVKKSGGLAILGTERHESRRVDRQLRGRAGRQGDPGTSQFFVSLEDDLMRMFGSDRIASLMDKMGHKEGEVIQHSLVTRSIERAQKKVEENNFGIRKRLLEYDDVMNKQRNIIYKKRANALFGEQLSLDIDHSFYTTCKHLAMDYNVHKDLQQMHIHCLSLLNMDNPFTKEELEEPKEQNITQTLYEKAIAHYHEKKEALISEILPVLSRVYETHNVANIGIPLEDGKKIISIYANIPEIIKSNGKKLIKAIEKTVSLVIIDEAWKEHLKLMDDLRQSVQNAVYEQKDPLVIYKGESFELFQHLDSDINKRIISFLNHCRLQSNNGEVMNSTHRNKAVLDNAKVHAHKEAYGKGEAVATKPVKQEPVIAEPKIGRNNPCPCGSGKKYKHCHGK